jgi:hypothetical protein
MTDALDPTTAREPTAVAEPVPPEPESRVGTRDQVSRSIALLLAGAAVVAAIIGTRATLLSGSASTGWQRALRIEVQRAAATGEDIRFVYGSEGRIAYLMAVALVREDEFRAEAERRGGAERDALLLEAEVQAGVAAGLRPAVPVAADDRYALPDGGFDLPLRLADKRAENPDMVALDPDAQQASADRSSTKAVLMAATTIPVGITFLLGALAQPYRSRRRALRATAFAALVLGGMLAIVVELAA